MSDKRLIISEEDLDPRSALQAAPPVVTQPAVDAFPPVAGAPAVAAGAPRQAAPTTAFFADIRGQSLLAGLAAIGVGWVVTRLGVSEWMGGAMSEGGRNFRSAVWVALLGGLFALVFNGWDAIRAQQWDGLGDVAKRCVPIGLAAGFVSGFLAQVLYGHMLEAAFENVSFDDLSGSFQGSAGTYFARTAGWAVFGAGVGAVTAALVQSARKLQNGVLGGAIGGAAGGLVFEFLSWRVQSEAMVQLFGLLAVGGGIGLAIGVVEVARRDAWLHITGGGMTGKEFILYEADSAVGASPKCAVTLIKDPAIQPYAFVVGAPVAGRRALTVYEGAGVTVNGQPVTHHQLRDGDVLVTGSTSIRYAERAAA